MDAVAGIFNKLLVATPLLLVTSLGLKARDTSEAFNFTACSAEENQMISNYAGVATLTENAFLPRQTVSDAVARSLGREWIAEAETGKLKPLPQVAIDDSSRDGVKFEIVSDSDLVAEALNYAAAREAARRDFGAAAKDAVMAARVLQVTKYFDFFSLASSSMLQRKSVQILKSIWPYMADQERQGVKSEVALWTTSPRQLQAISLSTKFLLITSESGQQGEAGRLANVERFLTSKDNLQIANFRKFARHDPASFVSDEAVKDLVDEYKLGLASTMETNRRIRELL